MAASGRKALLIAILKMVCLDAVDGIEKLWILLIISKTILS